ncbi:ESX secretion-associated protein EspG [Nocardia sp. NEAU-G5]|uniref:ESX secretion-associated protein EspG n=1 Tax=Nocardia albiluteola TaxID=2842303 RepID=A0ABS6B3N0_9NOCA|nr:ESX secretion-associated protein EspG [Nocardia albiluteola]MBU3064912.1 ESX secretion-associated protein EspG [Nocardia albiluteola]
MILDTQRSWKCDDLEFLERWRERTGDRYPPSPLAFRTSIVNPDELQRQRAQARERMSAFPDPVLDQVIDSIARPDIRVTARALGPDPLDTSRCVRILATRRGGDGYIVTQQLGQSIWHATGYTIVEFPATALAEVLVRHLPKAGPGRRGEVDLSPVVSPDDVDHSHHRPVATGSADDYDSDLDRARAFVEAATDARGVIEIEQGASKFGPRGVLRLQLGWRDLADDGRYALLDENPPLAVGVDAARLTALINARIITVIETIKDENLA